MRCKAKFSNDDGLTPGEVSDVKRQSGYWLMRILSTRTIHDQVQVSIGRGMEETNMWETMWEKVTG